MRKWTAMRAFLVLGAVTFLRTTFVLAAGVSCDARLDAVDKLIRGCQKLSSRDAQLNKVYAARISEQAVDAQALRRDHPHWLADRDGAPGASLGVAMEASTARDRLTVARHSDSPDQ